MLTDDVDDVSLPVVDAAVGINESQMITDLVAAFPEHVSENQPLVEFMALIVLKYRNYDMITAKERLGNYLSWRKTLFGDLSDHTMETDDSLGILMQNGFMQTIMPPEKGKGPVILLLRSALFDNSKFTTMSVVKVWHYLILSAMKRDNEVARHGVIVINNLTGAGLCNIDRGVPAIIGPAVTNCMPVRLVRACLYNAPWIISGIINVVKLVFSAKMQKRVHSITDVNWFRTHLCEIIPVDQLPVELGGAYKMVEGDHYEQLYRELNLTI